MRRSVPLSEALAQADWKGDRTTHQRGDRPLLLPTVFQVLVFRRGEATSGSRGFLPALSHVRIIPHGTRKTQRVFPHALRRAALSIHTYERQPGP